MPRPFETRRFEVGYFPPSLWNSRETLPPSLPEEVRNPGGGVMMAGKAISHENPLLCASERPRLPEDTVFYAIFPDQASQHPADQEAISVSLKELHVGILDSVALYAKDYIWQHEPFNLSVSLQSPNKSCVCVSGNPTNGDSEAGSPRNYGGLSPLHLHGKVRYGDNVEDEWFVVFLMYEISRRYSNASVRIWDTDGEFLLIEAAFSLPRWVKPENSSNRVFIRQGKLHLIPERTLPSPTISDSLRLLSSSSSDSETRAPDAVEAALERRIVVYPDRARQNMHRTRCRLPLAVAQVLKHEPQMISLAVEGFYDRDIDSMKFASLMEKFLSGGEMVDVSVRMSRAMYAQLVQQVFQAPKCYPMPPLSDMEAFREAELGMKIACGFEMMYQQRRRFELGSGDSQRPEQGISGHSSSGLEGLVGVNAWEAFVNSLNSKGYFRGLLPGSKEYQRLMDEALDYYRKTSLFSKTSAVFQAPIKRIDEILSQPYSANDLPVLDLPPDDDDSWMYNGEEELQSAMLERQKEMDMYELERQRCQNSRKQKGKHVDSSIQSENTDFSDIAKSMKAFVNKVSSYKGAEIPEHSASDEVQLNVDCLIKEMETVIRNDSPEGTSSAAGLEDATSSSSDMDFDVSDDDLSDSEPSNSMEPGDSFMQSYSDALNDQLKDSTLRKSFLHANDEPSRNISQGLPTSSEDADTDLTPVDMDVNLVQSLIDSFSSQQGLPGPGSNLLGLLGLQLPRDSSEKK